MDVSVYEPFHAWTCHATTVLAWLAAVISVFITGYFSTFSLNICTKVTENCRETLPEVTQVTPLLQQTLSCYLYACYNLAPRVLKEWRHSFIELEEGMASFVHRVGEDKRKDVAVHQQHTVSCLKVTHLLSIEWITSFIRSVGEDNKKDVAEITQLQSIKWMTTCYSQSWWRQKKKHHSTATVHFTCIQISRLQNVKRNYIFYTQSW